MRHSDHRVNLYTSCSYVLTALCGSFQMLPKEEYFMPPVNLRVRDHRAFGRKPTVGMHVIRSLEKYLVDAQPETLRLDFLRGAQQAVDGMVVTVRTAWY